MVTDITSNRLVNEVSQWALLMDSKILNIFLIGSSTNENESNRKVVRNSLAEIRVRKQDSIEVHYPETYFQELVKKTDWLTLENILADSVDGIIICPESPGSLVELGAFVNRPAVIQKIYVVAEKEFETEKNFINLGPLKYLKSHGNVQAVHWVEKRSAASISNACKQIVTDISKTPRHRPTKNLITASRIILLSCYLMDGLSDSILKAHLEQFRFENPTWMYQAAKENLRNSSMIARESDGTLIIQPIGIETVVKFLSNLPRRDRKQIDNLRLRAFNEYYEVR